MKNRFMRVFLSPDGGGAAGAGNGGTNPQADSGQPAGQPQGATAAGGQQSPAFDYEKLASLVAGKQTVTEESVLKGYFKQQGLSQDVLGVNCDSI